MIYPKDDPNGDRVLDLRGYEEYADNKPIILQKSATLAMRDIGLDYGNDRNKISYVIIPPNSRIADGVFEEFHSLQTVYNLNTCYRVDSYAFSGCSSLSNSNLSNCEYVGNYAFQYTGVTFSNLKKCEYIGNQAFYKCTSLVNIECPNAFLDGDESTGRQFAECTSLEKIRIKSGINIPTGCFTGCQNLQTVYNLNKCIIVHSYAFSSCYSLSNSDLSNCECVSYYAFDGCSNIAFSNLKKCKIIGGRAFRDSGLTGDIDCSNALLEEYGFQFYNTKINSIKIHKPTKIIPQNCFNGCDCLRIVYNLNYVDVIGDYAFFRCGLLSGNNRLDNCTSIGAEAFEFSDTGDIAWNMPKCKELGSFAFMGSYTHRANISSINIINDTPFYNCRYLEYIKIPKQKYLNTGEFYTENAQLITIYNLKYVSGIGNRAFYNRTLSNNTILIDTNSSVDPDAFVNCQVYGDKQEWNLPNYTVEYARAFNATNGTVFHCKDGDYIAGQ